MFFGQLGVRYGDKLCLDCALGIGVTEPADRPVVGLSLIVILLRLIKGLEVRTNQHEKQNRSREKFHEAPC